MANPLKQLNALAKKIRKAHPTWSYKTAQKEAGKKYRAGKKKSVGRVTRKKAARPKRRKISGVIYKTPAVNLGGIGESIGSIKSRARNVLKKNLATALVTRELATKARAKKKAAKRVAAIKKQIKTFS